MSGGKEEEEEEEIYVCLECEKATTNRKGRKRCFLNSLLYQSDTREAHPF